MVYEAPFENMTNRSRSREVALQLLFQRDHNAIVDRAGVERFVHDRLADPALRSFCLCLFDGVVNHAEEIDQRLTQAAEDATSSPISPPPTTSSDFACARSALSASASSWVRR